MKKVVPVLSFCSDLSQIVGGRKMLHALKWHRHALSESDSSVLNTRIDSPNKNPYFLEKLRTVRRRIQSKWWIVRRFYYPEARSLASKIEWDEFASLAPKHELDAIIVWLFVANQEKNALHARLSRNIAIKRTVKLCKEVKKTKDKYSVLVAVAKYLCEGKLGKIGDEELRSFLLSLANEFLESGMVHGFCSRQVEIVKMFTKINS